MVDDLDLDPILEVTQLGGSELSVTDNRVRTGGDDHLPQLVHFAPPDVGGRIRAGTPLNQSVKDLRTSRLCQQLQLGERSASAGLPVVHTPTSTTRSSCSRRYSTSVTS